MRILYITTGSQATVYAVAPLLAAARTAGHDVLLAANESLMRFAAAVEIPAVSVTPTPTRYFVMAEPDKPFDPLAPRDLEEEMLRTGRGYAKLAAVTLDPLLDLADDWAPDLLVGGSMNYVTGPLAAHLKIPYARHVEYLRVPLAAVDPVAERSLAPELERRGLAATHEPDLFLDPTPPSLRAPHPGPVQPVRYIPRNPQRTLEPWMYTRPAGRPRVLVTSGNHFRMLPADSLLSLVRQLAATGAEVLLAAPDRAAEELRAAAPDGVRVGWMPLDVVAPTCDLAVDHAGATTAMTLMSAGVPQVLFPPNSHTVDIAEALTGCGAALTVLPRRPGEGADLGDELAACGREVLASPRYAERARALAAEMAAMPAPADVVRTLEKLTG
ncbi:glycosyltransferase [Streptomyces sp. 184]|uniref:glycosyltransferase n=1 Tax=Streptomyces sp. 184 TaxID=1827526 RepID=UPI0038921658